MQPLMLLRRRTAFPSGFFTQRTVSSGNAGSSHASTSLGYAGRSRFMRFSDSSRSRPPRSGGSGTSRTASPAKPQQQASQSTPATVQRHGQTNSDSPATSESSTGGHTRQGASTAGSLSDTIGTVVIPRFPVSISPVPILPTTPKQVSLDGFYSAGRPLLEVTLAPKARRTVADRQLLDIVGEPTEEERRDIEAAEDAARWENGQGPFSEYEAYLVAEPEGSDPQWGDGTDKYLATRDHTVTPSAPDGSAGKSTQSGSSKASMTKLVAKKRALEARRQQNVDYLFPIQAEERARAAEEAARQQQEQRDGEISRPLGTPVKPEQSFLRRFYSDAIGRNSNNANEVVTHPGYRFLASQQVKNEWTSLWEWEAVRKALAIAEQRSNKDQGQPADDANLQVPLDSLRQSSRIRARSRARSKRAASSRKQDGSTSSTRSSDLDTLKKMFGGDVVVIQMPPPPGWQRDPAAVSQARKQQGISRDQVEEIARVLKDVKQFSSFFDKSANFPSSSGKYAGPQAQADNPQILSIEWEDMPGPDGQPGHDLTPQEWKALRDSGDFIAAEDVEVLDSDSTTASAAWRTVGPRLGLIQTGRGRALRAPLKERLAARGVSLVPDPETVQMDSVKRKRRKRISKHKYRKRRKANRAERRRTGK